MICPHVCTRNLCSPDGSQCIGMPPCSACSRSNLAERGCRRRSRKCRAASSRGPRCEEEGGAGRPDNTIHVEMTSLAHAASLLASSARHTVAPCSEIRTRWVPRARLRKTPRDGATHRTRPALAQFSIGRLSCKAGIPVTGLICPRSRFALQSWRGANRRRCAPARDARTGRADRSAGQHRVQPLQASAARGLQ